MTSGLGNPSRVFFERYTVEEGATFGTFRSFFDVAWEAAGTGTSDLRSITASASSAPITT
ncbi:MAG: hypothetical protein ABIQ18_33495 [Umezawaea sp.]